MSGAGARGSRPVVGVIGDVAVDVLMRVPDLPYPGEDAFAQESATYIGSCGANVCTILARLAVTPRLFAKVGNDHWGQHALSSLADEGISRRAAGAIGRVVPHIDLLISDEEDTFLLGGSDDLQAAMHTLAEQAPQVVVKRGSQGCVYTGPDGVRHVPAPRVTARDTTGAGDSFVAGLASACVAKLDVSAALEAGVALGAAATLRFGTGTALPGVGDAITLLRQRRGPAARAAERWLGRLEKAYQHQCQGARRAAANTLPP